MTERLWPKTFLRIFRCIRCGKYWTTTAGAREHFTVITKFCPDCIAIQPTWGAPE